MPTSVLALPCWRKRGYWDVHRATSNKRAFYFAEQQSDGVDWVVSARWVEGGKIFISSGVSAGTNMALALVAEIHGHEAARELADSLEYNWHALADVDPFAWFTNRLIHAGDGRLELVRSEPVAGATLSTSPRYIRL